MNMRGLLLTGCVAIAVGGCAAIFSPGPDPVAFRSEPEGADVLVNGEKLGVTPVTLELKPSKVYIVTFRKDGYEDATVTLTTHVQAGWVVLDILTGVIGVAVDAGTGEWKAFDSGQHFVEMEPNNRAGCHAPHPSGNGGVRSPSIPCSVP